MPEPPREDPAVSRRPEKYEVLQVTGASVALVGYVYVIGWLVTLVRLSAAHVPIDSSLPAIDSAVMFAVGARAVLVMAIVFAAMCAAAYAVHWRRWDRQAERWNAIVKTDRMSARQTVRKREPLPSAGGGGKLTRQERLVRLIAGFNVGVLSLAIGLVLGRFTKTLIDDWQPGHWWALLAPWAVWSIVAAFGLGKLDPLKGDRRVHGLLWLFVGVVAMVTSAPIGLLVLTWAGIGTLGRRYGSRQLPGSKFDFLRSPLPWVLLTIYALFALAYSAIPPVSFSQTVLQTTNGTRIGGYLGRTGSGVYLASCTPLADATSINDRMDFVPAGAIRSIAAADREFTLDTGSRPSLATLALRAFGVDAHTPAWIRPELKERRAPCAGVPPPRPSTGYEVPQLGSSVFAGSTPPAVGLRRGDPRSGQTIEQAIEQTTPKLAALARRFQPTLLVTAADPFWPVSVGALLEDIGSGGKTTCLYHQGSCATRQPTLEDLKLQGSTPGDFLEFPATPALSGSPRAQLEAFLRGQRGRGSRVPSQHEWLSDPGVLDPWATAQIYFFYAGTANPARWPARPAANQAIEKGLVGLQYWFFYPYNFFPTVVKPELMNDAPVTADVANTDLHQGDWEHVTVLVNPRTEEARWLYTARHSDEGEYLPWNSPRLTFDEGHPLIQAAYGGHPSYDAQCGPRPRYAHGLEGLVSDWLVCGSGRFAFRATSTPLVDIAQAPWACWKGHFGVAPPKAQPANENEDSVQLALKKYYHVAGPRSPLWQAENGHLTADGANEPEFGPCLRDDPKAPEREAIHEGIGRPTPRRAS